MQFSIAGRLVGDGHEPYLIAEIGQNHNGDVYEAIRLVGAAVKAGADAVKFQLRNADEEIVASQLDSPHPRPENAFGPTYRDHRAALDLTENDLAHISQRIQYNEWPIHWFATPCDVTCVAPLMRLEVPCFKIASKDLQNLPLIEEVGQTRKPVILSTGMGSMIDIEQALNCLPTLNNVVVMQCVSQYPTDVENWNLNAIQTIREEFGCLVGLSDHSVGILAPALAVVLGACMVEKHITLARSQPGTDHSAALEPDGLQRVARDMRNAYIGLGNGKKEMTDAVAFTQRKLARSLVTKRPMKAGEVITESDLAYKSPGTGYAWREREAIVGYTVAHDLPADHVLQAKDLGVLVKVTP